MAGLRLPAAPANLDALRDELAKAEALERVAASIAEAERYGRATFDVTMEELAALLDAAREEGRAEALTIRQHGSPVLRQPVEVPGALRIGGLRQPVYVTNADGPPTEVADGTPRVIDPFAAGVV